MYIQLRPMNGYFCWCCARSQINFYPLPFRKELTLMTKLMIAHKLIFVSIYWLYDMTIEIKIIVDKFLYINFVCLRSFNKTENTYDQINEW